MTDLRETVGLAVELQAVDLAADLIYVKNTRRG